MEKNCDENMHVLKIKLFKELKKEYRRRQGIKQAKLWYAKNKDIIKIKRKNMNVREYNRLYYSNVRRYLNEYKYYQKYYHKNYYLNNNIEEVLKKSKINTKKCSYPKILISRCSQDCIVEF
jgi:hypothetical protein